MNLILWVLAFSLSNLVWIRVVSSPDWVKTCLNFTNDEWRRPFFFQNLEVTCHRLGGLLRQMSHAFEHLVPSSVKENSIFPAIRSGPRDSFQIPSSWQLGDRSLFYGWGGAESKIMTFHRNFFLQLVSRRKKFRCPLSEPRESKVIAFQWWHLVK